MPIGVNVKIFFKIWWYYQSKKTSHILVPKFLFWNRVTKKFCFDWIDETNFLRQVCSQTGVWEQVERPDAGTGMQKEHVCGQELNVR